MNQNQKFTFTTKTFSRTESGKSWRAQPDSVETREINEEQFHNHTNTETLQWFRRLGGSETATRSYQSCGYIVSHLTSTNPGCTIRKVKSFAPISL